MDTKQKLATISKDVAVALWGEPNARLSKGDKLRWGNKGSKKLDADKGVWKDFEADTGGGVLTLIERECQTDREGAKKWLRDNGYWVGSPISRNVGRSARRSSRPTRHTTRAERPRTAQKPVNTGASVYAQQLWAQAKQISETSERPFRVWARARNLLHPYCAVPGGIRWNRGRSLIVCGVFPLSAWEKDGTPFGLPVAVQALAIEIDGGKRYCLGPNKDRDKCSYGPVSEGIFILGDPAGERVNIVEGVADALAVYSREPGAVLATLGTSARLASKEDVIDWLITKETWLYPDDDENKASEKGTAALIDCIKVKSPDTKIIKVSARVVGDDPGEWAKRNPFPDIEIYDFKEKKGILFDSGMARGEADRMAVQTLNGEQEQ